MAWRAERGRRPRSPARAQRRGGTGHVGMALGNASHAWCWRSTRNGQRPYDAAVRRRPALPRCTTADVAGAARQVRRCACSTWTSDGAARRRARAVQRRRQCASSTRSSRSTRDDDATPRPSTTSSTPARRSRGSTASACSCSGDSRIKEAGFTDYRRLRRADPDLARSPAAASPTSPAATRTLIRADAAQWLAPVQPSPRQRRAADRRLGGRRGPARQVGSSVNQTLTARRPSSKLGTAAGPGRTSRRRTFVTRAAAVAAQARLHAVARRAGSV